MNKVSQFLISTFFFSLILIGFGCVDDSNETYPDVDRRDKIPVNKTKYFPDIDLNPPIIHSNEFEDPIPLSTSINTAGAEDSPFMLPDGNTLYFFFTPDVDVPPEKQLLDDVSGIWVSQKNNNSWTKPERVWLQDPGKLALDGAVSIQENEMWFASAREGYESVNIFLADKVDGKWKNWRYSGDSLMKEIQIGEVHIHGDNLYFHSDQSGGNGSYDIWVTTRNGDSWSDPVNIEAVNTDASESLPFISPEGDELWFTRTYLGTPSIYRSIKGNEKWSTPELIVSQFAGEPTLDEDGNLYFVHHYYENGTMIEADIYVAYKK